MTVHFIGAGPGAPDLITVRGLRLIQRCPVVPLCRLAGAGRGRGRGAAGAQRRRHGVACTSIRSWPRSRPRTRPGHDVARVHSGDPSLYGAISEQIRRLDALGIAWTITPGVPAFAAAAAALGGELTLPDIAQSVVVTRTAVRASAMPEGEDLKAFAAHRRHARASISRSTTSPASCAS